MGLFSKPEVVGLQGGDADRARIDALERRVAALEAQLAGLLAAGTPSGAPAATAASRMTRAACALTTLANGWGEMMIAFRVSSASMILK